MIIGANRWQNKVLTTTNVLDRNTHIDTNTIHLQEIAQNDARVQA